MDDFNSWMRGTHEFYENRATMNFYCFHSTCYMYISQILFFFLLSLFVIKAHEIYLAPTSATTEENSTYMLVQLLHFYQYTTTTVDLGYYMYNIPERLYSKHITLHLVSTKHFAYQMALKKSAYSTFNNIFVTKFIKAFKFVHYFATKSCSLGHCLRVVLFQSMKL